MANQTDQPFKAFRLLVAEADNHLPNELLKLQYVVMAKSFEEAVSIVRADRRRDCEISLVDDGDETAAIAKRNKLAPGQAMAI